MEKLFLRAYEYSVFGAIVKRLHGFWAAFMVLYKNSDYGKGFERLFGTFSSAYCSSSMYKAFTSNKDEDKWLEKSFAYKMFSSVYGLLDRLIEWLVKGSLTLAKGSILIGWLVFLRDNVFRISLRYFGVKIAVFGIFKAVIDVVIKHQP